MSTEQDNKTQAEPEVNSADWHEMKFHYAMVEMERYRRGLDLGARDIEALRYAYNELWMLAPNVCLWPIVLGAVLGEMVDRAPETMVEGQKHRRIVLFASLIQLALSLEQQLQNNDPYTRNQDIHEHEGALKIVLPLVPKPKP